MDNEEEIDTAPSIWNKKQDELTVADNLKLGIGITAVATVAPVLVLGLVSGAVHLWERFRTRKQVRTLDSLDMPPEELSE